MSVAKHESTATRRRSLPPCPTQTSPTRKPSTSMVGDDPESFADLDGHCTPQTP